MPFVNAGKSQWTSVVTTTADTAVQNRGGRNMYVTTESTGSLPLGEGYVLSPGQGIVISTGKTVSVNFMEGDGQAFYVVI
jgi:hypothetical protein